MNNIVRYLGSKYKCIHHLFEEIAKVNKDKIAVEIGNQQLTYEALNQRANQLAHFLKKQCVKAEVLVGVCIPRSFDLIIALLGIFKCGGAYIPLPIEYPKDRLQYIIKDSGIGILLTTTELKKQFYDSEINIICIDKKAYLKEPKSNLSAIVLPDNLAYVIYTSGSTGKPKGVSCRHGSLTNRLLGVDVRFGINADEICCLQSNTAFVDSTWDIFGCIARGCRLVLYEEEVSRDAVELLKIWCKFKITRVTITPSLLRELLRVIKENGSLKKYTLSLNIKHFKVTGEAFNFSILKDYDECFGNSVFLGDCYGATEATSIIYRELSLKEDSRATYLLRNTEIYLLDEVLSQVPVGEIGELYIAGEALARGYLNQPGLTAEKFIPSPFVKSEQDKGSRLYRTGDLGRYKENGAIEILGRVDDQVKIRGFRIEPREIESVIQVIKGVRQCVVAAKDIIENEKKLVAYLTLDDTLSNTSDLYKEKVEKLLNACRATCKIKLPYYMQPSQIMILETIPLTINGKIDKKALPMPKGREGLSFYEKPLGTVEKQLTDIWKQLLKIRDIGRNDSFFELGGSSILAIRLVNKINNYFKSNIKIKDVYEFNNIASLSVLINKTIGDFVYKDYLLKKIDKINLFKPFGLTNVQQAYYLGRSDSFELGNISTHVYREFKFGYLNLERLEKAFNMLIARHLALRTIFIDGSQIHLKKEPYYKIKIAYGEKDLLYIRNQLSHKVYDISTFPLFDVIVSKYNDYYILHISYDDILMDNNSSRILFHEWTKLYNNLNARLPAIQVSFRDYVCEYKKIRNSQLHDAAKKYWVDKLDGYNFELNLPLKQKPSAIKAPKFTRLTKTISRKVWWKLQLKAQQEKISSTAIILTIYGAVLAYWAGQDKVCVNLTLFNRLPLHPQIDRVMGDFTVLELFNYIDDSCISIERKFKDTHKKLWEDIEHNLFDGIDFQRLIRNKKLVASNKIIAPVVLTSVLGDKKDLDSKIFIDNSYQGEKYSITQTSQVWLDNKVYEVKEGLVAEWDYVEQLFNKEMIQQMHHTYCSLIEYIAEADWKLKFPNIKLSHKDIKLIKDANCHRQTLSEDTLFGRYERLINEKNYHDNIAVIDTETKKKYLYRNLIQGSNLLARYLIKITNDKGAINLDNLCKGKLIGVLSEKGYNQIISVVSIMKSGHGYLPLNVVWPTERIDSILEQGNVTTLLISKSQYNKQDLRDALLRKYDLMIIEDILNDIYHKKLKTILRSVELPTVLPDDIAYVIFTSGSTGKPKGVTISHRGVLNTIDAVNKRFNVTNYDKILALSELSFDLSVYDMFGPILQGGGVVFPEQHKLKDPSYWLYLINKYKITIWNTVPQMASLLIDELSLIKLNYGNYLRLFLLSGDWIPVNLPEKIKKYYSGASVISLGGATEGSIWSIWYEINKVKKEWHSIPYGVAMPNQKIYILNDSYIHCPVGVKGEIYIGGIGVALSYWNDKVRTTNAFVNHKNLGRLYRTGDLGKWHADGYVEFLGRDDWQVKIRGYRIELEEIDFILSTHPLVRQAVTVTKGYSKNNRTLVSYISLKHYPEDVKVENGIMLDKASRVEFKLAQHNIRQLPASKIINLNQSRQKKESGAICFKRKSYRTFCRPVTNSEKIDTMLGYLLNIYEDNKDQIKSAAPLLTSLNEILSVLKSIKINEQLLPKYRYASAGSLYPVQVYLEVQKNIDAIEAGYYYYNPQLHALQLIAKYNNKGDNINFYFIGNMLSIEPLYGSMSEQFCFLELGYMLQLLVSKCNKQGMALSAITKTNNANLYKNLFLEHKDIILGGYKLNTYQKKNNMDLLPEIYIYIKNELTKYKKGWYQYDFIKKQPLRINNIVPFEISIASDTNYSIYGQASFALFFLADKKQKNEIELLQINTGMISQSLMEQTPNIGLGLCPIGRLDSKSNVSISNLGKKIFIQAMFGGSIGQKQIMQKGQSNAQELSLTIDREVKEYLAAKVPDYMQPNKIIVLEKMPLTSNGKIDRKLLLESNTKNSLRKTKDEHYILPQSKEENEICKLFAEILGIPTKEISINDDFFDLGGDSILAAKLLIKINSRYNSRLKLSDLYLYRNISRLLPKIFKTQMAYQPIIKLNNTYKKPIMFMIHPGGAGRVGGSEVYLPLAKRLANMFTCYGVDSYNLYNIKKILSLRKVSEYYLSCINKVMNRIQQDSYHILGWSLGGLISLEMACILEQEGYKNIYLYLLDPIVFDDYLLSIKKTEDVKNIIKKHKDYAALNGLDEKQTESIILNGYIENSFLSEKLSGKLDKTKILLFKAMLEPTNNAGLAKKIHRRICLSKYNYVNTILNREANIKLIKLDDVHHKNILTQENLLAAEIASWATTQAL